MTSTSCAIIGLASWYVAVLLLLAVFRVYISAATRKAANTFVLPKKAGWNTPFLMCS